MVLRAVFFVLMALGLVGFGTVAWITSRPSPSEAAVTPGGQHVTRKAVIAAAHPLRAGALLKPEDLTAAEIPADEASAGTLDTPEARRGLVGAMIRRTLAKDEAFRAGDVMKPGEHGFLAAVLQPGLRAMTIPMDAANGSVGLIWPGDRIDLILTQANTDAATPAGRRVGAATVLTNARVIAIDRQLVQGASAGIDSQPKTVTLEVNAEQAQRVSVAMRLGQLSLAVRSATPEQQMDAIDARGKAPTWARDVVPSLMTEIPPNTDSKMRIYQGTSEVKEFKF